MENSPIESQPPVNALTVTDLEALIIKIVQELLKKEPSKLEKENLQEIETLRTNQAFLNTFGIWEDTSTAEEIILDIYNSRTYQLN
jgi:hypothetical protein